MRHYLLLLISVSALVASSCASGRGRETPRTPPVPASVVEITDANYEEVVRFQSVVLVLFWAPWSAPDRPMLRMMDVMSNEYSGRVKIAKVDVDENPAVSQKFNIKGIPTVVVLKDGTEQERTIGLVPKKKINELLDKQLN